MVAMLASLCLATAYVPSSQLEVKVKAIVSKMTLDEKLSLLTGVDGFYVAGIPRLGLPRLKMSDGPVGLRNDGISTAYPAGESLTATWDTALARAFGDSIARDARARGVHFWLGPGVDLARLPQNGRNFEYFGEDPTLASDICVPVIQGVQAGGVVATVKHYAANDHENDRMNDSEDVDPTTMHELYLKPFQAAVQQAHVWAVMCAYNRLDGIYCSANPWLLQHVLKDEWGFKGIVMSDWGAVHDTLGPMLAGLDLEMPGGDYFTPDKLKPLIADHSIPMSVVNDKVTRIVRLELAMNFPNRSQVKPGPRDNPKNAATAYKIAAEGMVLLKNSHHILPLKPKRAMRVVVLGPNATADVSGGGGSSYIQPLHFEPIATWIKKAAPANVHVTVLDSYGQLNLNKVFNNPDFQMPFTETFFHGTDLQGAPVKVDRSRGINFVWTPQHPSPAGMENFSARWTSEFTPKSTGNYIFATRADDGIRVFLNDKEIINDWSAHAAESRQKVVKLNAGTVYHLRVEYFQGIGDAIAHFGMSPLSDVSGKSTVADNEVKNADVVIACMGMNPSIESEGIDHSFNLPDDQQLILNKITKLNHHVVMVFNSGEGLNIAPWMPKLSGLIEAWYPGQEGNRALANIIYGKVNPSGKLPETFPVSIDGTYMTSSYPAVNGHNAFPEKLLMGYRWFDAHHVPPLFPFGFGLSYTTFKVDPSIARRHGGEITVPVTVKNTGKVAGAEVAQLYVGLQNRPSNLPIRELKGFTRVNLQPGESRTVMISIKTSDLDHWNETHHRFELIPGKYIFWVGTSSADLSSAGSLTLH